jgi:hypothetical protein
MDFINEMLEAKDFLPLSNLFVQRRLGSKNCFYALGRIIWDVHPGCRIRIKIFSTPDPGVKKTPNLGSATLLKRPKIIVCDLGNRKL